MKYDKIMATMLKEYKTQAILGIWGGLFISLIGYLIFSIPQGMYLYFGRAIMIGGYILIVAGSFMYAKGKGYTVVAGLLGLLGPLGLLLLYCLKDKSKIVLKKREREISKTS